MNSGDRTHIWPSEAWPHWTYDLTALAEPMAALSHAQGLLMGRLIDLGLALRDQTSLAAVNEDVVRTSEIEGESLNVESVRSSVTEQMQALEKPPERVKKIFQDTRVKYAA
ncbi:MAG TPA: DUF4172 domain-containing protein [bacterium]|nr:DUF4172 domain-containing protein [bacterium]